MGILSVVTGNFLVVGTAVLILGFVVVLIVVLGATVVVILFGFLVVMVIRVVEFSRGGKKLEIFLPKNQHNQRKLLNFEYWCNGEVSNSAKI